MHSRLTTIPGCLHKCHCIMLSSELTTMIIFREHEINSHIGSGYDLWRDDNVTRDGEGLYRFHWEDRDGGGNALIISWLKSLKHFPVGGGDESASCLTGGKLFKALVRFEHFIFINVMHMIYIFHRFHNWILNIVYNMKEVSLVNLIFRYVQLSFTAVHPPYQAPKKFLRLHTQVTIITLITNNVMFFYSPTND